MKASEKNIFRIVVSIVFIALGIVGTINGITSVVKTVGNGNAITFHAVWSLAFNVVMALAGLLGLMRMKKQVCIILSFILFIGFAISFVSGLFANAGVLNVIFDALKAVCAWFYIACIDSKRKK